MVLTGDRMDEHGFGALPPPEFAWQMGKTAASILFVKDAERFIASCDNPTVIEELRIAINKVRSGQVVLSDWTSPEDYLKNTL